MRWKNLFALFLFVVFLIIAYGAVENSFPSEISIKPLVIKYTNFDGSTTDFNSFNQTGLSNLNSVILEILGYGKVEFNENLDVYSMAGPDWIVDFDNDLNISDNLIYVDEYNLPGINKSANLTIENISVPNPVIYNKGVVCTGCELISYLSGKVKFYTDFFEGPYYIRQNESITYCGDNVCDDDENVASCPSDCNVVCGDNVCSVGENPSNCIADCPAVCGDGSCNGGETSSSCPSDCEDGGTTDGGGGSSGGTGDDGTGIGDVGDGDVYDSRYDFSVSPTLIEASIPKGSYFQRYVTLENNGTQPIIVTVNVEGVEEFVFPSVRSISLVPGESGRIRFDMYFSDSKPADIYIGKINFASQGVRRNTNMILNLEEREALFDIRVLVTKRYINPGGRIRANISLINMGDLRNFDVNLDYSMVNFDREEYITKGEQFAINKTYSNIFFLDVPEDTPVGDYVFYATVRYKDVNATSYDTFIVEKLSFVSWIILILIILFIIYLVYDLYRRRRRLFIVGKDDDDDEEKESLGKAKTVKKRETKVPDIG